MASHTQLLRQLRKDFPQFRFAAGDTYCWSPAEQQITYYARDKGQSALFSLLHELGHGLLQHKRYMLDFELLELEVAAWQKARQIAPTYAIDISETHIQDCLDTYRDWLFGRSICPRCGTKALQCDDTPDYRCYNCHEAWSVAPSRFCRPYRSRQAAAPAIFL